MIAPLIDGGFVMVYDAQFFTAPPAHVQTNMIMAQRFDRNGAKVGPEFQVDEHAAGFNLDRSNSIIGLSNGRRDVGHDLD